MSDELFTIRNTVGRVIEARVFELRTEEDATRYSAALAAQVMAMPRAHPVLCADHRPVRIYPQPVTDRLIGLFVNMNTQLERVAILVARSNATLHLQLQRVVREAGYENRRVFHDADEALTHLAVTLDGPEKERVRAS